jgi:capsular exopolysaccharide synthesis family protein
LVAEASDAPNVAPQHRFSSLALLAVLAAAVAALIAYLLERFDRRLTTSDDVPRLLGLPLLASIPALSKRDLKKLPPQKAQPVGFLEQNSHSSFAEALRVLWVNLSHGPQEDRPRTIVITSALPGEGKTSTALCLARTAASARSRVVLVDCDLRRRSLNYLLGLEPRRGIVDVLNGVCTLEEAIGHDPLSGADVLPATAADNDASSLFSTNAMRTLLGQLAERYDLVILDSAPVLPFADSRTLASIADGAIIVTRSGKSDSLASRAAANHLENVGATILGVVFNAVSQKPLGSRSYVDSVYFDYARRKAYTV